MNLSTRCRLSFAVLAALVFTSSAVIAEVVEGRLDPFLGEPSLKMQTVFDDERFPNIVVTMKGTLLATWGNQHVRARRSEDGGSTWGEEITIAESGFQGGGTLVDETSGDILVFVEAHHPPAPLTVYRSRDDGKSWLPEEVTIHPDQRGNVPSMHMNESGITLRHGEHAGRLLRTTRDYAGANERELWPEHTTGANYSDDGGQTWNTSEPFPEKGTGEAAVAELSDGRIVYNSRVHWDQRPQNTRRRQASSNDGGQSWTDWEIIETLPDGRQDNSYGCMGGLTRLPVEGRNVLIFSNIDTPNPKRERATVWASFDGGQTWPVKRLVYDGNSAYSSLAAGRHGTPSEGWIYLLFEGGPHGAAQVARFNLSWLLEGETTGDGEVPAWATPTAPTTPDTADTSDRRTKSEEQRTNEPANGSASLPAWVARNTEGNEVCIAVQPPDDPRFAHLSWNKVIRTPAGNVILAYLAGTFHGSHGGGSPAVSRSTDGGQTFSPPKVLREFGPQLDYSHSGNLALGVADDGGQSWSTEWSQLDAADPDAARLAAPFAVENPEKPGEILVLTTERAVPGNTPGRVWLWRGDASTLQWNRERVLLEFPRVKGDPHTDFGYPWLLHLGGNQWQLHYYHGQSRGPCALWMTEVTLGN